MHQQVGYLDWWLQVMGMLYLVLLVPSCQVLEAVVKWR